MTARTLFLLSTLASVGCGDDGGSGPGGDEGPVYVMMSQVYTTDDRIIYFSTTDSLDVDGVSFGDAIESPGVANFTTLGGKLYISDGEEPKITQYSVNADHSLEETGAITFQAFPLGDNANFYYHLIVDENLAYLPYETTKRIAWNPSEMTIISDEPTSTVPATQGALLVNNGGNRTAVKFPSGPVLQPFFYTDENWLDFGTGSKVASYDKTSHAEARVQDAPCPGLTLTTRDEDGNTYLSSNVYSPLKKLFNAGPAPCVVKAGPDGTIDPSWTTDLSSMTGGRYVMEFRYLRDGLAYGSVLDHEALGLDFQQPYDSGVEQMLTADVFDYWLFDLRAGTAKPITGIDVAAQSAQFSVIDDRMFLFLVFDEYGKTRVVELSEDGVATKKFDVDGDVFKWERLR